MLATIGTAATAQLGQLIALAMMALALGMDAFSLGIGVGMRGIRLLDILKIGVVVGAFHVIMPLAGIFTGNYVSALLGNVAAMCGGALLIIIGMHMVYSSLRGEHIEAYDHRTLIGLTVFALSVSIDSFSAGISLGLFHADIVLTILMLGLIGGMMTMFGLLLGRRFRGVLGEYGEAVGGIILIAFGVKIIW